MSGAIKLEHVDRLTRGQRSGKHIGSRSVGHRLNKQERAAYQRALRSGYLLVDARARGNLWHVWEKACQVREQSCWILVREQERGVIYRDMRKQCTLPLAEAKVWIAEQVT